MNNIGPSVDYFGTPYNTESESEKLLFIILARNKFSSTILWRYSAAQLNS